MAPNPTMLEQIQELRNEIVRIGTRSVSRDEIHLLLSEVARLGACGASRDDIDTLEGNIQRLQDEVARLGARIASRDNAMERNLRRLQSDVATLKPIVIFPYLRMILDDACAKIYAGHEASVNKYRNNLEELLQQMELHDTDANYLSVEALSMILDTHHELREKGNAAAHVASAADKAAAIISREVALSDQEREYLTCAYQYAYGNKTFINSIARVAYTT